MKRSYYLLTIALACLFAAPSYAQTVKVTFHVAFPFTAGGAEMPAGAYSISEDENGHALILSSQGGHAAAILLTRISGAGPIHSRASVSFVTRGGKYYLDSINLLDGQIVGINKLIR
jgi:hypothetical protein